MQNLQDSAPGAGKRPPTKTLADRLSASTPEEREAFSRAEQGAIFQLPDANAPGFGTWHPTVVAGEGHHEATPRLPTRDTAPITRYCPKCGHTMLLREFEYFLTGAEAARRGYQRNVRVKIEGTVCRACRPRKRPLEALTRKEIHNRTVMGDLHPAVAKARVQEMNAAATRNVVAGQKKRWLKDCQRMWKPLIDGISHEQRSVVQALKYLRHPPAHLKAAPPAQDVEQRVDFYTRYYDVLRALKARIKLRYIANDDTRVWPPRPDGTRARILSEREFAEQSPVMGVDLAHWSCFVYTSDYLDLVGTWAQLCTPGCAEERALVGRGIRVPPLKSRRTGAFSPDDR